MMLALNCLAGVLVLIQIFGFCKAYFEECDHTYNLKGDSVATLNSPFYPKKYPAGSSCRYELNAPLDYEILAECSIGMDKDGNACGTEYFFVSADGDPSLSGASQNCGNGSLTYVSLFRTLVIAYISGATAGSTIGGLFTCQLTIRPQACDCGWSKSTRIVGGEDAGYGEFVSMVGIYHIPSETVICGGSIVSHNYVATARHCTALYSNPNELLILAGIRDLYSDTPAEYGANYTVSTIIEHPDFDSTNNANDIALIVTNAPIAWSRGVGPVCLPLDQLSNTFDYTQVYLVGWGTTSFAGTKSNILQKVSVNIIPNSACETVYSSLIDSQACTYADGKDACQFDSGGPVFYKGFTRVFDLGIISYGNGCGVNPGVNTRVTSFIDWIQGYTGQLCAKPFT